MAGSSEEARPFGMVNSVSLHIRADGAAGPLGPAAGLIRPGTAARSGRGRPGGRQAAPSSAASRAADGACAPNTPPCISIIFSAAW